jgi:hypothetical protein
MTYTFSLACETKSGYLRYEHPGLGSIYLRKTLASTEQPPASISLTADGLAEPRAAREQDPAVLEAKATKAAERAQRAAAQAAKLAAQVEQLKAQQPAQPAIEQPTEKPTTKGKGRKAA